ncbi:hypothetical protein EVAR_103701_1 [Eumeta japonica]|uniref:Uncharacterized protein n=1 Tax=Eumeta variegata TaxID=151549 RepID=A0A4C1ZXS1_EUMVA|nr:hypothetical protein EVAR_103701_1 [Eumeta japonica]
MASPSLLLASKLIFMTRAEIILKYNQAEGIVYDRTIGPPGRWFWHSLNQPPQLQLEMVDEKCTEDCIMKILQATPESLKMECARPEVDERMAAVVLDNCRRQNETQSKRSFKPFAIRPKIFKLNEHFSLRIIDQNCIHLLFRDGMVNLKLHLGFTLLRSEIANIVKTEVRNVLTPYDGVPPAPEMPTTTTLTQFDSQLHSP